MLFWLCILLLLLHLSLAQGKVFDIFPTTIGGINGVLNTSSSHDTINLHPGTYSGSQNCDIRIQTAHLLLVGVDGPRNTIVDCGLQSRCISVIAVNVTMIGITWKNGKAPNTAADVATSAFHSSPFIREKRKLVLPRRRGKNITVFSVQFYLTPEGAFDKRIIVMHNNRILQREQKHNRIRKRVLKKEGNPIQIRSSNADSFGGCIAVFDESVLTMINVIVTGGQAILGSGIGVSGSRVTITGSSFDRNGINLINLQSNIRGGGGYFYNSTVAISNSSFTNNYLANTAFNKINGGGVYFESCTSASLKGPISMSNNTISSSGRSRMYGGGMYFAGCTSASLIGPISVTGNTIQSAGTGNLLGGGMAWISCTNTLLMGPISVANNTLQSNGTGYMLGGGMYWSSCELSSLIGSITVFGNKVQSSGIGQLYGGGMYWYSCTQASMVGPISVTNNAVISSWDLGVPDTSTAYSTPRTDPQCSSVTISNTVGSLEDGSFEQPYAPNLHCTWQLYPPYSAQFSNVLNFSFTNFDIEDGFDFLYIYDGSTSTAPLIGQYSGNLQSFACGNGLCPSLLQPITSSSGSIFLVFDSDGGVEYSGFSMVWNMIPITRLVGTTAMMPSNFDSYPTYANGAGGCIMATDINIWNTTISNNLVLSSAGLSIGGGIYLDSCYDGVNLHSVSMVGNTVNGYQSAGGAIAVTKKSLLNMTNCEVSSNVATTSYSKCLYFSANVICPSVFGGNMLVAAEARVSVQSTNLSQGNCSCNTRNAMCSAVGGSIAVLHSDTRFATSSSTCKFSVTTSSQPSAWNAGGCLYVQDATVSMSSATTISNNTVHGIAFGGGIFCAGSSVVGFTDSSVFNNSARQGGAVAIGDSSAVSFRSCILAQNNGSSVGGALFMKGDSLVSSFNTTFFNNVAGRASTVYSFNDNGNSFYNISSSNGVVEVGSSFLMLGYSNMNSNTWNCIQPGTVFVQDATKEFYSLTCNPCGAGSYAVDHASTSYVDRTCQTCPFGARCLGASTTSNGLYALSSFWGLNKNGSVKFYQCPSGYCCGDSNSTDCVYNYCDGNRTGLLCGRCADGYGMRFFADGCKSNTSCDDGVWFAWIIIALAFVAVIALIVTTNGKRKSGILSVLMYFYQVLPLIKSTPWKYLSGLVILGIQSAFNFSPSGNSSSSDGVCLIPDMTTSQKIGSKMLLQGVVCLAIFVTYVAHLLLSKISLFKRLAPHPPHISHYVATWIRFCTIAYTTLVLVPLQMIQCVDIDEHINVWWLDASIQCYQGWQQAGIVAICILGPVPLFVIWILWKKWTSEESIASKWQTGMYRVLSGPYRTERRWWLGVSLYRRFLLVVVYSTIKDLNWKAMAASSLCVIFLAMHHMVKPFRSDLTHKCESTSLLLLCMIAISASPEISQIQFGTTAPVLNEAALEWIQFALSISPAIGYTVLMAHNMIAALRRRRQKTAADNTSIIEREWLGLGESVNSSIIDCEMCKCQHEFASTCSIHQYC